MVSVISVTTDFAREKGIQKTSQPLIYKGLRGFGAGDRGRTGTVSLPPDFESGTSANSITPAHISYRSTFKNHSPENGGQNGGQSKKLLTFKTGKSLIYKGLPK